MNQTAHISLQVSNHVKQQQDKTAAAAPYINGATPATLPRYFPASRTAPLPLHRPFRLPATFPPPVKRYLGPTTFQRKREIHTKHKKIESCPDHMAASLGAIHMRLICVRVACDLFIYSRMMIFA